MILHALPDSATYNNERSVPTRNTVIMADTRDSYFYPEHRTPYLFVTNVGNRGKYLLNKRPIEVSERQFYFLNIHDSLEIRLPKAPALKTILILFETKFIEDGFYYLENPDEALLAEPEGTMKTDGLFPSVPFEVNDAMRHILCGLGNRQEEALFALIAAVRIQRDSALGHLANIRAAKRSTQEELYRRLMSAKDFMNDRVTERLTIEQIAQQSCLNKFHFLATFRQAYGMTPHRYLTELKLQKAQELLNTDSVSDVCFQLGFESPSSFSLLFKKRFGYPPSKA